MKKVPTLPWFVDIPGHLSFMHKVLILLTVCSVSFENLHEVPHPQGILLLMSKGGVGPGLVLKAKM